MTLQVIAETVSLTDAGDGVIRVGQTRVTLDSVIASFSNGATPEQIVQQFPTLDLADVYQVIGYYLRHPDEVESYLRDRRTVADAVRRLNESRFDPDGVRDRLLARQSS